MPLSLTEACHLLERNEPPISYLEIYVQQTSSRWTCSNLARFEFFENDDIDVVGWRRFGRAIGNNSTILEMKIIYDEFDYDGGIHPAADGFEALYDELKNNTSIEKFELSYPMDQILSVFDLAHFMQNNTSIKVLTLGSADRIFSNHARIIAIALAGVQLSRLDLSECEFFVGIELYEHIISQCLGVTELDVQCYATSFILHLLVCFKIQVLFWKF
jgi:hypothetical protein